MSTATTWLWLGLLVLFVVLNGLFVAAEYALIRLRKTRIEEMVQQNVRGARTIQQLSNKLDNSVAGAQLGITITGLVVGGIGVEPIRSALEGGIALLAEFLPFIAPFKIPAILAMAISFAMLTFLHVIIGEQMPKLIGLRSPEKVALTLSLPFQLFCRVTTPFLWLISFTTKLLMRLPGMPKGSSAETPPSVDELMILVENSARAGTIGKAESGLVQRALEYRGLTVRDVMVPASHMDCLPEEMNLLDALDVIVRTKHSRLPLYRGSRDTVVGILRTRELLDVLRKKLKAETVKPPRLPVPSAGAGEAIGKLGAYIRQPFFVKHDTPASVLLEELKTGHLQLAIVTDEAGKTIGLVTQEDLVEQLVGEIHDEDDGPVEGVEPLGENLFKVEASLTLYEFRRVFDARLVSSSGTTLAEVFQENYSGDPSEGASIELNGFAIKVLTVKADGQGKNFIEWFEVQVLPETTESAESGSTSGGNGTGSNFH